MHMFAYSIKPKTWSFDVGGGYLFNYEDALKRKMEKYVGISIM